LAQLVSEISSSCYDWIRSSCNYSVIVGRNIVYVKCVHTCNYTLHFLTLSLSLLQDGFTFLKTFASGEAKVNNKTFLVQENEQCSILCIILFRPRSVGFQNGTETSMHILNRSCITATGVIHYLALNVWSAVNIVTGILRKCSL
jgi:hypothetical protein